MIFVVDMGNSDIVGGLFNENHELMASFRTTTTRYKTVDEFVSTIKELLFLKGINPTDIKDTILSSVVPQLTATLTAALKAITKKKPIVVAPGIKTGLAIKADNPTEVGADLIAACVGAIIRYGSPCIVVDLGSATKICAVDKEGTFAGCIITPGVKVSAAALVRIASQLPNISLQAPVKVIGNNTLDSMNSGIVYGNASMIDGFIHRFQREMGYPSKVIATGGLAGTIIPYCETEGIIMDKALILYGLHEIYLRNSRRKDIKNHA